MRVFEQEIRAAARRRGEEKKIICRDAETQLCKDDALVGIRAAPTLRHPCERALLSGENPAQEALKL